MSPWSINSPGADINIGIGTREVAVGPRRPRWTPARKPTSSAGLRSMPMPETQWFTQAGAFDALRAALEPAPDSVVPPAPSRTRGAHIVLDDFWGNHAILRGDFRTLRAREIDEIARAHFVDTYGVDGETIVVRACVQRGGRATFASALPRALVDGMGEASASAGARVLALKLCLPEMLNRTLHRMPSANAMVVFAADALIQTVLIEAGCWAGYDAQRLFAGDVGDPAQVTLLAEQAFERCVERTTLRREDCALGFYGCGIAVDLAALQARFASVTTLARPNACHGPEGGESFARHLLEYAQ
ncbi:putative secretion system X (plasmid) [Paraburkholderia caribensis MBA4]|uniref:Putative secretion system X n=1 Tax=Paraburkholderia caribensis MBA4 TaxID=1323664 RepID=A0A0P0RPT5_9BURK|nr:hypothetical protein [Paraburkholderia caribensis]ALL70983.1 putative secretion system X [Paraburkholderia caribensis MBA4]